MCLQVSEEMKRSLYDECQLVGWTEYINVVYVNMRNIIKVYIEVEDQAAVSLTYLSILKEGFTPIFSATLSYGKRAFNHKKTGVTFPIV